MHDRTRERAGWSAPLDRAPMRTRTDERSRYRADGGDRDQRVARHAVGHQRAVRHAGEIDAPRVGVPFAHQLVNDGGQKRDVVDVLPLRLAAARAGVPRPSEPVGIRNQEAAAAGGIVPVIRAFGLLTGAVPAVEYDHQRRVDRRRRRRHEQPERARAAVDLERHRARTLRGIVGGRHPKRRQQRGRARRNRKRAPAQGAKTRHGRSVPQRRAACLKRG